MNLDATMLNDYQDVHTFSESRYAELGAVNLAKNSTEKADWISPDVIQKISEISSLREVEIPAIIDQEVTVTEVPGFEIPANLSTSGVIKGTAYDIFSGFRHYPAQYANNTVKEEFDLQHKIKKVNYGMAKKLDEIILSRLEGRKTQVLPLGTAQVSDGTKTFAFNVTTDTLEISKEAQKEYMFSNLSRIVEANEIGGDYEIVTSRAGLAAAKNEWAKYGNSNEKNLQALGFPMPDQLHETGTIIPGANNFNGYYVRNGSIAMYANFPADFRMNTKVGSSEWSISDMELPFIRMRGNVYTNLAPTNAEALVKAGRDTNLTMTHFQEMALWVRVYFFEEFNSDLSKRPNSVIKIVGLAS
ncbi:hypothetical protein [Chryseobacterium sp.]|uniref:hypothetical protein n=1 Tax=Chryseobacterium sp. TaxID=1871047 RepID=UPI00321B1AF4